MSLSEEMNKLAPKLTIVFQLTVWSIVGIILLQKGTIALYEKTKTRNDTLNSQGNLSGLDKEEALAELNGAESGPRIIKVEIGTRQEVGTTIDHMDGVISHGQRLHELHASYQTGSTASVSNIGKQATVPHTDNIGDARASTPTVYASNENEMESTSRKENVPFHLNTNVRSYNRRTNTLHHSIPTISFPLKISTSTASVPLNDKKFDNNEDNDMSDKGTEKNKNEKNSRRSPMNRIGAAIAILMLAIGIVMLLLGPLIVIVRAFSNRRRTREMLLKSREHNDRPPSYEEATLMDQAPRYSTLHVDNSDYMRNGDFLPTRLQAQQDAVNLVCHSKTRSNPENNVGLITLANVEVLATLTSDIGRILSKLHQVQPNGNLCLITGIRIAHLALKHRQGKNHKMRIVAFIGSPIEIDEKELVKLAKRLKKEKVTVDVISFGEESINNEVLTAFINALNGKDGTGSHLVTVPPGPHLSDALISSPIIQGEDGMGGTGIGGTAFEFGVDPNEDPELALALRVSMEEQRQRQEDEARRAQANEAATNKQPETIKEVPNEEAMLKRALAMSLEGTESSSSASENAVPANINAPDFARMTEEEQIAFAMQMSMQDQQELESLKEEAMEVEEDYAAVMSDPAFLQSVLENLPGVDPQSEAVRQAVGSLQQNKDKDKEKEKEKDKEKK